MRVLLWTELFRPYVGGIEVMTAQLVPRLKARGHELRVVTSTGWLDLPENDALDDTPITRLPMQAAVEARDALQVARLRQTIAGIRRSFEPDLEHLFGVGTTLLYQRNVGRPDSRPYVLTLQNALTTNGSLDEDGLVRSALRDATWVVGCSEHLTADIRRLAPEVADRASTIANAVAVPDLEPGPLPFDPPVLACIGRLMRVKGFDVALDAFARIAARHPSARLRVAGDGPEREALQRQADDLDIASRVEFTGFIAPDQIPAFLNEATVVLMPSRSEGLPALAVEAAIMARPIVGTRIQGIQEVVRDGETGLLVSPEDPAALAGTALRLLDDPDAALAMGGAARPSAIDRFSLDRCVDAYDALYRRVGAAG